MDILGTVGMVPKGREPSNSFQTDDPGTDPLGSASWV